MQLPCIGSSYFLLNHLLRVVPSTVTMIYYMYITTCHIVYFNLYHAKNIWHLNAYFILTVYVVYEYPTILKWYWFPLLSEHPKELTAPPAIVPDHAAPAPAFFWWSKCLPLPLLRDLVALLGPEYDCRAPVYGSEYSSAARLDDFWRCWHVWFSSFIQAWHH